MALTTMEGLPQSPWPPPEGCPAWCGLTHNPSDHPDDRKHFGPEHNVPLSLEPSVELGGGDWCSEWLTVYLRQRQDQSQPQITLAKGEESEVTLTLNEARDLARALYSAIDEAVGS